jgi:hypothetical protein
MKRIASVAVMVFFLVSLVGCSWATRTAGKAYKAVGGVLVEAADEYDEEKGKQAEVKSAAPAPQKAPATKAKTKK